MLNTLVDVGATSREGAQEVTLSARPEREPALEERPVWEDGCRSRGPRGPATDAEGKRDRRSGVEPRLNTGGNERKRWLRSTRSSGH